MKPAALRSGAGRYGRNGLIITGDYGSSVVLALLLTDAELPLCDTQATGAGYREEGLDSTLSHECRNCSACMRACPTGALDGSMAVDVSRCLRAMMFADRPVPEAYRSPMGNLLLGCDACQRVCPANIRAREKTKPMDTVRITLDELFGSETSRREALNLIKENVGANYARSHRVLAQAALLAGNSGDSCYLAPLIPLCDSSDESLREHARWAVNAIRRAEKK